MSMSEAARIAAAMMELRSRGYVSRQTVTDYATGQMEASRRRAGDEINRSLDMEMMGMGTAESEDPYAGEMGQCQFSKKKAVDSQPTARQAWAD